MRLRKSQRLTEGFTTSQNSLIPYHELRIRCSTEELPDRGTMFLKCSLEMCIVRMSASHRPVPQPALYMHWTDLDVNDVAVGVKLRQVVIVIAATGTYDYGIQGSGPNCQGRAGERANDNHAAVVVRSNSRGKCAPGCGPACGERCRSHPRIQADCITHDTTRSRN